MISPTFILERPDEIPLANGRAMACTSDVCINEIIPNPNGYDNDTYPNGEWLELYNFGSSDVDLTGWSVSNSASKVLLFDSSSIIGYSSSNSQTWTISPGEYVVIARNGNSNFWLTNTQDVISLLDASSNTVDEASWGSSASSGVSYEEDSTNPSAHWIPTSQPTPGQQNSAGGPVTYIPADIVISEVMANPWPSLDNASYPGGEWIEVYNTGSAPVDLTGWSIVDAAGNTIDFDQDHLVGSTGTPESSTIRGGEYRLLAVNSTGAYGVLNNGVESITLKWPNGSNAQLVEWSSSVAGFSTYGAPTSTFWSSISSYPTPNATNAPSLSTIAQPSNDIIINEILPNATSEPDVFPDGEWIEIHNQGTTDIDLMGWSIIDGMGNTTYLDPGTLVFNATQGATIIQAGAYRIVQFSSDTRLWDEYNHIVLRDALSNDVDMAWYTTDYGQDIALERDANAANPWIPALWKTPGQPAPGSTPSSADLRFSEILPDGIGSDSQDFPNGEWIEIENFGSVDIDITDWKLQAAGRSFTLHEHNFPYQSDGLIPAGHVGLIALNGTSSFYLKHTSADTIVLVEPSGAVVDTASWNQTEEGKSLVRSNTSHAGLSSIIQPDMESFDFVKNPWATPNQVNPEWQNYVGSTSVEITEIYPYCPDSTTSPQEDWIEFHNVGTEEINLSRWQVMDSDGVYKFITSDNIWSNDSTNSTIVGADERVVVQLEPWFISGLGDSFQVLNPDHVGILEIQWDEVTECKSLARVNGNWTSMPWTTPGESEPDLTNLASYEDIKITRFMPDASTSVDADLEFIEISNTGTQFASLDGWTLRHTSASLTPYNTTIQSLLIAPESSVVLASDSASLAVYEDGTIYDISNVLNRTMFFSDSGAAIQLEDQDGNIADVIVYENGPVTTSGWEGISLVTPLSGMKNLIYVRGDGCEDFVDTNAASDWQIRWQLLGGSAHCGDREHTGTFAITPLIGPESGIHDVLSWINGAEESLHIHIYQFHSDVLAEALINAHERGVAITVIIDAGDSWWTDYELEQNKGIAVTLLQAGIDVKWFGTSSSDPYLFLHSKIGVRDSESVWIGSGNWKQSSLPAMGESGNREWGMILENDIFAQSVLEYLESDEEDGRIYLDDVSLDDMPDDWTFNQGVDLVGAITSPIQVDGTAELFVCPDDCIQSLVSMIEGAENEIILSLQYLDLDWSYGWGENPLITSLEQAASRGVSIRLILNGAYLDSDIQTSIDLFNEEWNATLGYDTAAIVMAPDELITKLHNKGAIIDGSQVLISSINWGDSALIRNREMGILLSSDTVADIYRSSWLLDWNRLSTDIDSDLDGMDDKWEEENGLHRTRRSVIGESFIESEDDPDNDGLPNLAEYQYNSNPLSADTDNDCIPDGLELQWAQAQTRDSTTPSIDPHVAMTSSDANENGIDDGEEFGCDLSEINQFENTTNTTLSIDDDEDGVPNENDFCPSSPVDELVNSRGCTADQENELSVDEGQGSSDESNLMLYVMMASLVFVLGAFLAYQARKKNSDGIVEYIESEFDTSSELENSPPTVDQKSWVQPVLDGSLSETEDVSIETSSHPEDERQRLRGWSDEMIQEYLDQGWTIAQLVDYYENQVQNNADIT